MPMDFMFFLQFYLLTSKIISTFAPAKSQSAFGATLSVMK